MAKTTAMILRKVGLINHEKTGEMATPKDRTRPKMEICGNVNKRRKSIVMII